MKSLYIQQKRREKFARFTDTFASVAIIYGVLACLVAFSYEMGRVAGIIDGVEQVQQCEQMGANGYAVSESGVDCIYE